MPITVGRVQQLFVKGRDQFLEVDRQNILDDVSERNWAGRLAIHLHGLLPEFELNGYCVDPEYNRNDRGRELRARVKTILGPGGVGIPITCDIVIHRRGAPGDRENLLAIEMKKSGRPAAEAASDRLRLRALTSEPGIEVIDGHGRYPEHVCGYLVGVFMEIDIARRVCVSEFFTGSPETRRHWDRF